MEALSVLLQDLELRAEVFFSGGVCGVQSTFEKEDFAHLHFLKSGKMRVLMDDAHPIDIDQPSVIFLPGGSHHRLFVDEETEAEVVCANIHFSRKQRHMLIDQLPQLLTVPVSGVPSLQRVTEEIFEEAFAEEIGRQWVINRLCDVFMMRLMRHVLGTGLVNLAQFTATTQPAILGLVKELAEQPQIPWTVESMAEKVAMSRSKFSGLFKQTLGLTPLDYLTELRIDQAQNLLLKGKSVSWVAEAVGYENASSLARVFKKRTGQSPKQWLSEQKRGS